MTDAPWSWAPSGLHVAVRCGTDERQRLEQLCWYITRPALPNEREQCKAAGQVVPRGPEEATGKSELTATESGCAHGRAPRINGDQIRVGAAPLQPTDQVS